MSTRPLLVAILVLATAIPFTPGSYAQAPVGTLTGTAGPGSASLSWSATSASTAYKVYASTATTPTWPGSYSLTQVVQQSYTDVTDEPRIDSGSYSNTATQTSAQSFAADASKPYITSLRVWLSPNNYCTGDTINIRIATQTFTLAGGAWQTSAEVGGVTISNLGSFLGTASDTPFDVNVDFVNGRVYQTTGPGVFTQGYTTIAWTGAAGAPSSYPVQPYLGANGGYVEVAQSSTSCVLKFDAANPYAGGTAFTSSSGTFTSVPGSDLYHLAIDRAGTQLSTLGTTLVLQQENALVHYRVLATSGAGDASAPSNDLVLQPTTDWAREIANQTLAGASWGGTQCGPPSSGTVSLLAGHSYVATFGFGSQGANVLSTFITDGSNQYVTLYANGSMSLGGGATNPILYAFSAGAGGVGGIYGTVGWTMSVNANVQMGYSQYSNACNFGSGGFYSPTLPPGVTNATQLNGLAGIAWDVTGYMPVYDVTTYAPFSEVGIENTEATTSAHVGSVSGTGFNAASTMQQINSEYSIVSTPAGNTNVAPGEFVQSFTPDTTKGLYVGHSSFGISTSLPAPVPTCTGAVSVSLTSVDMVTNGGAWNASNESANITATLTKAQGGSFPATLTVDWANGTISDTSGVDTYTSVTLSIAGNASGVTPSILPPLASSPRMFLRYFTTCASNGLIVEDPPYGNTQSYSGGVAYTRASGSTSAFTIQTATMQGLTINVYGGTTYAYQLPAAPANVGGSLYVYVYEIIRDAAPQQYTLSTSFGGGARFGTYEYAAGTGTQQVSCRSWFFISKCTNGQATSCPGNSCVVLQEWRIGYQGTPEWSTSATWTLTVNDTASGRNQLFVALINQANEPPHPHVGSVTWTPTTVGFAPLQSYEFFSTNDYYATLNATVRACLLVNSDGSCGDTPATGLGAVIPNGTYTGTITSGGSRYVAGTWSPNGSFSLTGQDVQGGTIRLQIAAQGYVPDANVVISVPNNAGTYTVNLTMLPALQGTGLGVTQSAVQVTFNATNPQFTTGQFLLVSVNRTLNVDLWVILFQLDTNGNPNQARGFSPYDWTPSQNNELDVSWPDGRALNDADSGAYVLGVFIASKTTTKGVLVAYDSIGVNQAALSIGTSLLTNLNVAGQNDISQQAQVNNAVTSGAVTEATVQQDFLTWLDWFPRTDFFVPNAILYPALFMIGALMLRFGRQQWGR